MKPPRLTVGPMGWWTHLYLRFRIWLALKLFSQLSSKTLRKRLPKNIIYLGWGQYLKRTSTMGEARVMDYLYRRSSIPVPRIIAAWYPPHPSSSRWRVPAEYWCWILMEAAPGVTLEDVWKSLTKKSQRLKIARDLQTQLCKLRQIPKPQHLDHIAFGDYTGQAIFDAAFWTGPPPGPWEDYQAFMKDLLPRAATEGRVRQREECRLVLDQQQFHQAVLTHGDIAPRNIIIDPKTLKIVGIIDWTTAGVDASILGSQQGLLQRHEMLPQEQGLS